MRILYVALTRAREKLVITGAVKNARKAVEKWLDSASVQESRLSAYDMLSGANFEAQKLRRT